MADALLGVAFEKLTSLLQSEFSTISKLKSKAENLSTTLGYIKAVLDEPKVNATNILSRIQPTTNFENVFLKLHSEQRERFV